ncbi:MAG: alpha/beta hydrolase [Deinococcota bacterium]
MVPVIFLPGTLCDARVFAHQTEYLRDVVDARVLPLTVGSSVHDCATWILDNAPEAFVLVGFSQGGLVAFEIWRRAPEQVLGLALLAVNPGGTTAQQQQTWNRWRAQVMANNFDDVVMDLCLTLHPNHQALLCGFIQAMAASLGEAVLLHQLAMLESRGDSTTTLPNIICPTLLMVGQQDTVTPLSIHEMMLSHLAHAELHSIADCGHYLSLEQPDQVSRKLRTWLEQTILNGNP